MDEMNDECPVVDWKGEKAGGLCQQNKRSGAVG